MKRENKAASNWKKLGEVLLKVIEVLDPDPHHLVNWDSGHRPPICLERTGILCEHVDRSTWSKPREWIDWNGSPLRHTKLGATSVTIKPWILKDNHKNYYKISSVTNSTQKNVAALCSVSQRFWWGYMSEDWMYFVIIVFRKSLGTMSMWRGYPFTFLLIYQRKSLP